MSPNPMIDAGSGRQVPVSRRSALRTGGLAAIAASLLGTTTAPVAAQTPALAPLPWLGSVAAPGLADLTAECERLHDRCRETLHEAARLDRELDATLTPEQRDQSIAADNALGEHHSATIDWYIAEIGRHLPGIAPAIFAIWEHVREELGSPGVCCFPDPMGDAS